MSSVVDCNLSREIPINFFHSGVLRLYQTSTGIAMADRERSQSGEQKDHRGDCMLRYPRLLRSRHTRQFSRNPRGSRSYGRRDDLLLRRHYIFLSSGNARLFKYLK